MAEKMFKMVNNERIEMTEEEVAELQAMRNLIHADQWKRERQEEYGPLGDQLDLLWNDIDKGMFGSEAKKSSWYMKISSVKAKHPKPEEAREV